MPDQLVRLLQDVSAELARLGEHAAAQANTTRATALGITLEAVKAGVPPGKLRDAAVQLRQEATQAAERLAHDRTVLSLRIGQALARATTLARESDVLAPTRTRAAMIGSLLGRVAELLVVGGELAVRSPVVQDVHRVEAAVTAPEAVLVGSELRVRVARGEPGSAWEATVAWEALAPVWLAGDLLAWSVALAGVPVTPERHIAGLTPRVWLQAGDRLIAASHPEEPPGVAIPEGEQAAVVELHRRRVAVARIPPLVAGLEGWRVLSTAAPRLRAAPSTTVQTGGRRGNVILFPGIR